ncbi:hypothetical protein COLO4_13007 [Corchorus olitorius]|uniref:Glabrous enhancer-binding protein-like DBD domain-containing protein n=1 Tax=Corchorus olitorius TaxID=93759 RepID=A0A1R3JYQ8_9ROSI|nr:hypothetical protein COLO4_13007 [Corchorus olitorius]
MSRKRPIEQPPPSASSSEEDSDVEEDEEESSDGEKENNSPAERGAETKEDAEEDDEDDEEDEDEEEEEEEEKTPLKKQKTISGKDGSDSESESESDKSLPSPNVSDFTIKPIVSKPQKSALKSTPNPKSVATESFSKRKNPPSSAVATESSSKRKNPPSSASNGAASNVKTPGVKTPGGARVWSEADEIAILKGMIEFKSKKGSDPNSDSNGFHDFIKQSIQAEVSKNQLIDKMRRLKQKYKNNAEKGQNGNDPVFSKPHDHKSFELSKKIWGNEANEKIDKSQKKRKTEDHGKSEVEGVITLDLKNDKEVNASNSALVRCNGEKVAFWKDYPHLKESFEIEMGKWGNVGPFQMTLTEEMAGVIGKEKLKEMEGKFRKLRIEELKLYLKRIDLVREQAQEVLNVLKGSNV